MFALLISIPQCTKAADRQPAFPGAGGYGKYVTGGRGGEVCYVTRLDDCSDSNLVPGTLRWALRHDKAKATHGAVQRAERYTLHPN